MLTHPSLRVAVSDLKVKNVNDKIIEINDNKLQ